MSEATDRPAGAPARLQPRLGARLRAYLIAGVLVTAPIGVTLWIAWTLINWIDGLAQVILPARYNLETYLPFFVPGFGILVLVCLLTLIGMLAAGYVGRLGLGLAEAALARMPVIRGIYTAAKQIFASVLASRSSALRQVVLVEAPRPRVWSLGFLTGPARGEIEAVLGADFVNVVVPNAPNPTTAYLMFVPRRQIVPLAMSAEEAIKLIISGGIVTPEPPPAGEEPAAAGPGRRT